MQRSRLLLAIFVGAAIFAAATVIDWGGSDKVEPDESILHRGLASDPDSLDPHKATSIQAADVWRDIGEGLTAYSADGKLVPGAAEHWDISDDRLTYTFHLRAGLRWSNGDALTADHFEFAFKRLVDPETMAFYATFLSDVADVSAVDDRTFEVTLERPLPYLLSLLTHPSTFPLHPTSLATHGDAFTHPGNLLSNGAYMLESWEQGSVIKLQRNEQYWNDANTAIDVVHHHIISEEAVEYMRYKAGDLHVTANVPPASFQEARQKFPSQLRVAPTVGVYYYGFNLTKAPFKDQPGLRRALSMAIDREVIVEKITGRGEEPAYSWVPPGIDSYTPAQLDYAGLTQQQRNEEAQRLYAAAGYDAANPLKITLHYNTSDVQQRIALAVESMWRETLGVETELINVEFKTLVELIRQREVTQVFRLSWFGDYNDAHAFLSIMESDNASNMPAYENADYDQLMDDAAEQADPIDRREKLEQAEHRLLHDHAVIPIYFFVSKHLVKSEVRGWEDNVLDYHYSQHLSLDTGQP